MNLAKTLLIAALCSAVNGGCSSDPETRLKNCADVGSCSSSDGDSDGDVDSDSDSDGDVDSDLQIEPLESRECGALESNSSGASVTFRMNHLGFDVDGGKEVVVETSGSPSQFQVVDSEDQVVACGDLEKYSFSEWEGGPNFFTAEFSYLQAPGTYRLLVDGEYSDSFAVGEDLLFETTIADVIGYFNKSRASNSGVVSADSSVPLYGGGGTVDAHGGWYDASGDISKYLSHLSYANFVNPQQIPLVAWSLAFTYDEAKDKLDNVGQGNAARDEALWGADYLVRVQSTAGYFYITVFDGWTGDTGQREICAFEGESGTKTADYQAAFREGGGMAIAALARISKWNVDGDFTSEQYLETAEAGFSHLEAKGPAYCDDGKENIIDDYTALLAATELYAATENEDYLSAARSRADNLKSRLHGDGYFIADEGSRPFWHASDAGLPVVALVRYTEVETDEASRNDALQTIETHLGYLLKVTNGVANPYRYARQTFKSGGRVQDGFFIPHDNETGYWWQGENARLSSLAAALVLGARALGWLGHYHGISKAAAVFAGSQLDWVLGKNPRDICFMHGYGRNNPAPYQAEKTDFGQRAHDGGISNGITGAETNGSGIEWDPTPPTDEWGGTMWWLQWRWVEQWLPHSSWYLIATAAMVR